MSSTPLNLLSRIAEIKRWGEINKERLLKEGNIREQTGDRTPGSSRNISSSPDPGLTSRQNNSSECIFPEVKEATKNSINFDELIERKLKDRGHHDVEVHNRPKRPFLRRGSGLARYRMKPGDQIRPNKRFPRNRNKVVTENNCNEINTQKNYGKCVNFQELSNVVSPLKKPDLKFKAYWSHVAESVEEEPEKGNEFLFEIKKMLSYLFLILRNVNLTFSVSQFINYLYQ